MGKLKVIKCAKPAKAPPKKTLPFGYGGPPPSAKVDEDATPYSPPLAGFFLLHGN